jgi:mono/diheme cytochrome c family protein
MMTITILLGAQSATLAHGTDLKTAEFHTACASCHGEDGKGPGFVARVFRGVKAPDLTLLAKNNGGEFPTLRIYQMIDGRTVVPAHGHRQMPVWGDRYTVDEAARTAYGTEPAVRARIQDLVEYLKSIQQTDG